MNYGKLFRRELAARRRARVVSISSLILDKLAELGEVGLDVFFPAKYPQARLWRRVLGLDGGYQFNRESFSALLSRLRAEKLVERSGSRRRSLWRLTPRGRARVEQVLASATSIPKKDGIRRLVVFDIPEKQKAKREAIRGELAAAGFSQLQKSVWMGDRPLPGDFMELVDVLGLQPFVHIFSVQKEGTLHNRR